MDDLVTLTDIQKPVQLCGECAHKGFQLGDLFPDGKQMICKRYPPVAAPVTVGDRVQIGVFWPYIQPADNCGEFRPL